MRILIVEDEPIIAERLERLMREIIKNVSLEIHTSHTIADARTQLTRLTIDVLFLDLNVNSLSGFDLLDELLAAPFHTIIVSAYQEEALKAFEYGVLDFVPKPFNQARLEKSLKRLENRQEAATTEYLFCKDAGRISKVDLDSITYVKAYGSYTMIFMTEGNRLIHSKSIDNLALILPARFVRSHRSYLADMTKAARLEIKPGGKYTIILSTGDGIPLSRSRYPEVKKKWFAG